MIHQDFQVIRLHVGMFRRAPEKIVRMLHDKLVERRRRGHQHRARSPAPPPGASCPLPCRSNRACVAGHNARIERPNINPQFERVRRHDSAHPPVAQPALNLPALARQISAAISAHRLGLPRLGAVGLLQVCQQHFRVQPAIRKDDRLQLARQQLLRHARRLVQITPADPQVPVHHWRIVENEKLLRRWRSVFFDHLDLALNQLRRQLSRICNRRRAANELWPRAIKPRDAVEPSQHICEVTPENAAVGVKLIQDDVTQILEYPRPPRVVRQNPGVQHVRIRQDDVAALADGLARVRSRIAIVGERAKAIVEPLGEIVQFRELVLRQRLDREEVEGARIRVLEDRIQHR